MEKTLLNGENMNHIRARISMGLESMPGTLHFSQSHWVTEKIMQSNGFQAAYQELEENIRKDPDTYAVPGKIEMDFQQTGDRDLYL